MDRLDAISGQFRRKVIMTLDELAALGDSDRETATGTGYLWTTGRDRVFVGRQRQGAGKYPVPNDIPG
jgi:hypothetical protein